MESQQANLRERQLQDSLNRLEAAHKQLNGDHEKLKGDAEAQKKQASAALDKANAATDALEKRRQDEVSQLEESISAGKQELASAIAAQERLKQNIAELE